MGSFRASVAVVGAHRGIAPAAVLEAARAGIATRCHVEDAFVDVEPLRRGGLPRVSIRFVVTTANDAAEDAEAWVAARALATAVGRFAAWQELQVHRRSKALWIRLPEPNVRGQD
jgi:hypothetical protein